MRRFKRLRHCKIVFMRIAIVKLSSLGDIVHAMVVLQFIKKFNYEISIDWIVEECYKDLLEYHPDINKVHLVKLKQAKKKKSLYLLYKELSRISKLDAYDLVIDMQGLIKSALISKLIPSKQNIGFDKYSSREKIASIFYKKTFQYDYGKNIVERNFELIKFALKMTADKDMIKNKNPFLFARQILKISTLSKTKKNIVLVPGASNLAKRYSITNFKKLINLLDANYFVIWGNDEEKNIATKLLNSSSRVNLCDKLSIDLLISLIIQVDLVIGPDTGPTHIAWALNKPSLTLFGPTPGYRNTYETRINKILESDSSVNPLKIDKKDLSIDEIKAEKIAELAQKILLS